MFNHEILEKHESSPGGNYRVSSRRLLLGHHNLRIAIYDLRNRGFAGGRTMFVWFVFRGYPPSHSQQSEIRNSLWPLTFKQQPLTTLLGWHQFNLHLATQCPGGFAQRIERHGSIGRIQQSVHCSAARFHARGHIRLGERFFLQQPVNLQAHRLFERARFHFTQNALFLKEIPKITATMTFNLHPQSNVSNLIRLSTVAEPCKSPRPHIHQSNNPFIRPAPPPIIGFRGWGEGG